MRVFCHEDQSRVGLLGIACPCHIGVSSPAAVFGPRWPNGCLGDSSLERLRRRDSRGPWGHAAACPFGEVDQHAIPH
ncbi:hypothetical protein NXS19_011189 [Fusarium pseudograminearum]|nr:hypothetical protein NXS19_011189 [Fusarium pseudograminearum]